MSEGTETPKPSLADLLKFKKQEAVETSDALKISLAEQLEFKKNEEIKRKNKVESDNLEDLMDEVDEKRVKIGDLKEEQKNLDEKQSGLGESLKAIKENVLSYKQKEETLKGLFNSGIADEVLAGVFKDNGINSWKDFLEDNEFLQSAEVIETKRAREVVVKSVKDRKTIVENIKKEQGIEGKIRGRELGEKIKEKKNEIKEEISKLRMETPEYKMEIKNENESEAKREMEEWFKQKIEPNWNKIFDKQSNSNDFFNEKLIGEEIDLNKEAKILGKKPRELWKEFYDQKINDFVKDKLAKTNALLTESKSLFLSKFEQRDFIGIPRHHDGIYEFLESPIINLQRDTRRYSTDRDRFYNFYKGNFSNEQVGLGLNLIERENKKPNDKKELVYDEAGILNVEKVLDYQENIVVLHDVINDLAYSFNKFEKNEIWDVLSEKKNKNNIIDKIDSQDKERNIDLLSRGSEALNNIKSVRIVDLMGVKVSEDLVKLSEKLNTKNIEKIINSLETTNKEETKKANFFKEIVDLQLDSELSTKEIEELNTDEEVKRGEKKLEEKKELEEKKDDIYNFSFLSDKTSLSDKISVPFDLIDGKINIPKIEEQKTYESVLESVNADRLRVENKIREVEDRRKSRGFLDGRGKKEDDKEIEELRKSKQYNEENYEKNKDISTKLNSDLMERSSLIQELVDSLNLQEEELVNLNVKGSDVYQIRKIISDRIDKKKLTESEQEKIYRRSGLMQKITENSSKISGIKSEYQKYR